MKDCAQLDIEPLLCCLTGCVGDPPICCDVTNVDFVTPTVREHGNADSPGLMEASGVSEFLALSSLFTVGVMVATVLRLNHRLFDRARVKYSIASSYSNRP